MKNAKRVLAMLLCIVMCVSLLPVPALAEGTIEASQEGSIAIAEEETEEHIEEEPAEEESAQEEPELPEETVFYVFADGSDEGDGSAERPFASLSAAAKAANAAKAESVTIILCSDLKAKETARFFGKEVFLRSEGEKAFTVTRDTGFAAEKDAVRGNYNPAMIEVGELIPAEKKETALTIENVILDDAGIAEGSEYEAPELYPEDADYNLARVQDAIITVYSDAALILEAGAELRNFGGMAAIHVTGNAVVTLEDGSTIRDTIEMPSLAVLPAINAEEGAAVNIAEHAEVIERETEEPTGEDAAEGMKEDLDEPTEKEKPEATESLEDSETAETFLNGTDETGSCGENLTYHLVVDDDYYGVLTISGTGDMYDYNSNNAPWSGYDFWIDEVLISDGVTHIGTTAFKSFHELKSIVLPESVTSIGNYVFSGCLALESVVLPDGITSIGKYAFSGCPVLSKITIPSGMKAIKEYTFSSCEALESITIPDSVETIERYAFAYCTGLKEVTISNNVAEINSGTFAECTSLKTITLPDSITTIQSNAFEGCTALTDITLSNNLSSLSWNVFKDCGSLESITIPASVTWIGIPTFQNCTKLMNIEVSSGNKKYCDVDGVLFNKAKTQIISMPAGRSGAYEIPSGVTSIESNAFHTCAFLEEVTLPDTLEVISSYAFASCVKLKTLTIPDSVTKIEWNVFSGCSELESVVLPRSITSIGDDMFNECSKLTSIDIPDSVTWIGDDAFRGCTSLTSVVLPPDLTSMGMYAFYLCTGMTSVVIPGGITEIEQGVFGRCDSLTDVYYEGTEEDWDKITVYTLNEELKNAAVHYGYKYETAPLFLPEVSFHYVSTITEGKEAYAGAPYDESWFLQSSMQYNHDLARMSIRMAMAAFGVPGTPNEEGTTIEDGRTKITYRKGESSSSTSEDIVELFEKLKFTRIELFYEVPGMDTIGYAIASKQFQDENGETATLIAVAVRGGGYEQEWASNFTVGTAGEHQGFSEAASKVVSSVQDHIGTLLINDGVEKNIKIWMTGYSRAAATTNIAAKVLTDYAGNHTIKGVTQDSIFAYCFECPRGVQQNSPSYTSGYNNIYSIVNYADVVPKVAPGDDIVTDIAGGDWNYGRYGVTYYLPAAELMSDYSYQYDREVAEYEKILREMGLGRKDAIEYSTLMKGQGAFGDKVVSTFVSFFKNRTIYCAGYQEIARDIGAAMGGSYHLGTVLNAFVTGIPSFAIIHPIITAKIGLNCDEIGYAHYPELCLAWMDALSGADEYCYNTRTRKLVVNCPVNVYVYDSSEKLVAEISWDEVQDIYNSTIAAYIDENGQKIIILPVDEEYEIEIVATDDGTVTYTVEEIDVDAVEPVRVVSYCEVEVEEWDTLIGTVEALTEVGEAEYALVIEDGEELTPVVDVSGSEAVRYTVTVSADEGGAVTGGGIFVTGEFAQVTATPDDGAEFLGWYVDEELVSEEAEYRFLVTGDVILTAKFGKAEIELIPTELNVVVGSKSSPLKVIDTEGNSVSAAWSSSDKEVATVTDRGVVTGNKVGTAVITATVDGTALTCKVRVQFKDVTDPTQFYYDPIYNMVDTGVIAGWADGTFRPTGNCNRAAVVTFLWRLAGKPEPEVMATFSDMPTDNEEFCKAISWAAEEGITTGYAGNLFKPWNTCNRAAIVTFLWRYADKPEPSKMADFKDMTTNDDFNNAISWAAENGITTGWDDNTFRPWNTCNRLAVASFLNRYAG